MRNGGGGFWWIGKIGGRGIIRATQDAINNLHTTLSLIISELLSFLCRKTHQRLKTENLSGNATLPLPGVIF